MYPTHGKSFTPSHCFLAEVDGEPVERVGEIEVDVGELSQPQEFPPILKGGLCTADTPSARKRNFDFEVVEQERCDVDGGTESGFSQSLGVPPSRSRRSCALQVLTMP